MSYILIEVVNRHITEIQSYSKLEEALENASSLLRSFILCRDEGYKEMLDTNNQDGNDWGPVEYDDEEGMYFGWSNLDEEDYDIYVIGEEGFKDPKIWTAKK